MTTWINTSPHLRMSLIRPEGVRYFNPAAPNSGVHGSYSMDLQRMLRYKTYYLVAHAIIIVPREAT